MYRFTYLQQVQRDKQVAMVRKGQLLMLPVSLSRKKNSGHQNKGNEVAVQSCENIPASSTPTPMQKWFKHTKGEGRDCKVNSECVANSFSSSANSDDSHVLCSNSALLFVGTYRQNKSSGTVYIGQGKLNKKTLKHSKMSRKQTCRMQPIHIERQISI